MHSELLRRAEVHLAAGRVDQARVIANVVAREIEPLDPEVHLLLSRIAHAGGDHVLALNEGANAVAMAPDKTQYRENFLAALGQVSTDTKKPDWIAAGARHLIHRAQQAASVGGSSASGNTRSVDLILPMSAPAGAELNAIETAARLRAQVPCRIWTDVPPHARLLQLDPSIALITADRIPDAETVAFMGLYMRPGAWLERLRPRRIILRYNVNNLLVLLGWLGATASLQAERIDVLFASAVLRDAVGIGGMVITSLIDAAAFSPRAIPSVKTVGRLSRDELDKHHPQDGQLYRSLLQTGLSIHIMGGTRAAPFLPRHERLRVMPAYASPAPAFLNDIDLFLYRTGTFFEAWGRVVFEAMASGLPVVCHRIGGYATDIRHGENGFLFDHNHEAVEIIAGLRDDSSTLRRIGEAARQTAHALSSPARQDELIEYFVRG